MKDFLENDIESNYEFYYDNMTKLRDDLESILKQKKMFSYGARKYFDKFIEFDK